MTVENSPSFDVLLNDATEVSMPLLAEAIAAYKKIPFQDAAHDARLAWGFIGKSLPEVDAENLAAIMESKGLHARLIPSGSIVPLPAAQGVKTVAMDAAGLHLGLLPETTVVLSSAQLSVIAALGLPQRSVSTEKIVEGPSNAQKLLNVGLLLSGIPISVGKKKRVIEKTTVKEDLLFYVDVLTHSPARRFRIDAQSLSYAFLKERMLHNTLVNFKIFLGDLTQWAPHAYINKGARMLIKNLLLSQMGYDSFAHLEEEMRWLSAL